MDKGARGVPAELSLFIQPRRKALLPKAGMNSTSSFESLAGIYSVKEENG